MSTANTYDNGLFDLAATAGLETQSTYILHTEEKTRKYSPMFSNRRIVVHHSRNSPVHVTLIFDFLTVEVLGIGISLSPILVYGIS